MKKESKKSIIKKKENKKIEKIDILIMLIIVIVFCLALLSFFPGLLTSDILDEISQAELNSYNNAHPIFHSFLIGNLAKLGGIWVPELFQIILFAIVWTYACKTLRKYNNCKANRVFQVVFTFIMAIIPLNFLYSITLWKDILYSYSMLALIIFIYIGIKEKYKYTILQLILIGISTVSIMKFRHNGVPIGFLMFLVLLILNIANQRKLKSALVLISSFVVTLILMTLPQWIWGQKTQISSVGGVLDSTKVYCMGALLNTDIQLENDEIEFLNTIMDIDKWRENYDPYTGTPILFNKDYHSKILGTEDGNKRFNEIFMKYAKQKPLTIIKHFINVNSIWWSIPEKGGMHSIILDNSYLGIEEYNNKPILEEGNQILTKYASKTQSKAWTYEVMYRPAFAILVSFIIIIAVCVKERKIGYVLILFPMLLNIGTYVFLMSSQDQRYFYPCFMTEYFAIVLFAEVFLKKHEYIKNNNNVKNKKPKTLVIIPAYNEEESIEKVVNSVYSENIDNCDVLVVNDGSKDKTVEKVRNTKAILIDSPNNLGIGGAVQTGYLYAKKNNYDIAIQLDGDGQHDPKYISKLIDEIKKGNDLVIGSRFVGEKDYKQTKLRMLGINLISATINFMTDTKIYDTTSGLRAVNKNIIEEFADSYPYDYPEPITNMEVIKKGYKIKEIPVKMRQRETGKSSISPLKSIGYMFKVILSIIIMGFKS